MNPSLLPSSISFESLCALVDAGYALAECNASGWEPITLSDVEHRWQALTRVRRATPTLALFRHHTWKMIGVLTPERYPIVLVTPEWHSADGGLRWELGLTVPNQSPPPTIIDSFTATLHTILTPLVEAA